MACYDNGTLLRLNWPKIAFRNKKKLHPYLHNPKPVPEPLPQRDVEVFPVDLSEHVLGLIVAVEVAAYLRPPSYPSTKKFTELGIEIDTQRLEMCERQSA